MLARLCLLVLLVPYALWVACAYDYHFIDNANLAFHEAGHVLFGGFGELLAILGGTLGQLAAPGVAIAVFLHQRRLFEAAVSLVWLGESLAYTSMYMADAMRQMLPLVGGHIHDWEWLFSRWGCLASCEQIAGVVHVLGALCMLAGLAAGGFVVHAERQRELVTA